ncbi:MAG: prepilin-type N-terminal cleavage/methylation domain-containing protein [Mariprofundaceae bacterium]|nr:prepilin-type N-terminal cleavage/methylation domain-containing protein [Mariprofundaceae bacterium]
MTQLYFPQWSARRTQHGFTLIEILIVLLMTAVALMALGAFSVAMMDSGTKSRERLLAVHLAEQVIEQWQVDKVNDFPPIVQNNPSSGTCEVLAGTSSTLPGPQSCIIGALTSYTVTMGRTQAQAPLPKKPNNAQSGASNYNQSPLSGINSRNMINTNTGGNPLPYVKVVTVSWTHKGDSFSIYPTHLTRI